MADQVVETIGKTAKTDKIGDGKIFVLDLKSALRVRTGETERRRAVTRTDGMRKVNPMKLVKTSSPRGAAALPSLGLAQDGGGRRGGRRGRWPHPTLNVIFILNSLLFLIGGFLVFWMAAGFAMLEAGLVRSKNVTMQLTKNVGLFSIAAIFYYLIGYNLMYPLGWLGDRGLLLGAVPGRRRARSRGRERHDGRRLSNTPRRVGLLLQLMFCATTASIVSGALAERIKLWPFLIFVDGADLDHLPAPGVVDLGRRLPGCDGLPRTSQARPSCTRSVAGPR
jgi:hypothetical protein